METLIYLSVGLLSVFFVWYWDWLGDDLSLFGLVAVGVFWPVVIIWIVLTWMNDVKIPRRGK